ncbi:MAG: DegT/DnrJ/EryC1/StrS family aminotransferase [Pseudomonadota bacterium]
MVDSQELIHVAGPSITDLEVEYAAEAARTAWFSNHASFNVRFEKLFADYIGVRHAITLPHCTAALHLSLAALDIGPGDEVIVPDVTWIASVSSVVHVGATPVFVDIDPITWCIDAASIEAAITKNTKAIIVVELYGSMPDWTALRDISARYGLPIIEDSAEALGSQFEGRAAGSLGITGTFSFHGSKTVVTGEGGMLTTDDDHLYERILFLRDHGRPVGDRFFMSTEVAFKYKMSALQAALGVAQMERIDELVSHKRAIFGWYKDRLSHLQGIALNAEQKGVRNSYWMVTAVADPDYGLDKFELMDAFMQRNIDTRPFFTPLSELPAFADAAESKRFLPRQPKGHSVAAFGINLPSGYHMTEEKVDLVCRAFEEIVRRS